jgi:hypothetical protein
VADRRADFRCCQLCWSQQTERWGRGQEMRGQAVIGSTFRGAKRDNPDDCWHRVWRVCGGSHLARQSEQKFQTRAPGCARRGHFEKRRKPKIAEDRKRRNRIRVTEDRVPECRGSEQPESESQRKDSGKKLLQHQTKSVVVGTDLRSEVVAERTTNAVRYVAPGAATQHAKRPAVFQTLDPPVVPSVIGSR